MNFSHSQNLTFAFLLRACGLFIWALCFTLSCEHSTRVNLPFHVLYSDASFVFDEYILYHKSLFAPQLKTQIGSYSFLFNFSSARNVSMCPGSRQMLPPEYILYFWVYTYFWICVTILYFMEMAYCHLLWGNSHWMKTCRGKLLSDVTCWCQSEHIVYSYLVPTILLSFPS